MIQSLFSYGEAMSAEHFDALCSSIGKLDEMDRRYVHLFDRYRVS